MTNVQTAVARQQDQQRNGPTALVAQYRGDFADVLPSHVSPAQWVRLAQGALRRGKREDDGRYQLEVAAANNLGVFLASLLDAARLGLEPGTEQYYLTPRKVKGRLEILGIVGYQGLIELMYRAGAVASVVAEVVHAGDRFAYQPGRDDVPTHEIDWDATDRGDLRLVYAYARMKDGAVSKVVVLNRADITRIQRSSQGADSDYSPWKTNPAAMWLKSAVRQLAKWVPTSAEYIREQMRAARDVASETVGATTLTAPAAMPAIPQQSVHDAPAIPAETRSVDDVLDGEIIHDQASVEEPPAPEPEPEPGITGPQQKMLHALFNKLGVTTADTRHAYATDHLGRTVDSLADITKTEATALIDALQADQGGAK
ncbi:MAG: recombinase RecT [Phycicoccus sp.]